MPPKSKRKVSEKKQNKTAKPVKVSKAAKIKAHLEKDINLEKYTPYQDKVRSAIEQDSKGMSDRELKAESNILRQFLKEINNELSRLIQRQAGISYLVDKKVLFGERPRKVQLKTFVKEIKNSKKMIKYLKEEHNKLRKRLSIVSEPDFILNLRSRQRELKEKIAQGRRSYKKKEYLNLVQSKKLDEIENIVGAPKSLIQINNNNFEYDKLRSKNIKLKEAKRKFEIMIEK